MLKEPLSWWKDEIGQVAAAGHALRSHFYSRWARLHSLPNSKRYPELEPEYFEVVRRATEVAGALFTSGEAIFLYRSRLLEDRVPGPRSHKVAGWSLSDEVIQLPANPTSVPAEDDDHYLVRALVTEWKPAFFETLIRQIADEQEAYITFVSPTTKNMYCPYDGGMDTFTQDPTELLSRFSEWRPFRSDQPPA